MVVHFRFVDFSTSSFFGGEGEGRGAVDSFYIRWWLVSTRIVSLFAF
jgi:hypothetical protein